MKNRMTNVEKQIKINPNDKCVCGSGLKFKNCCRDKKHEYRILGENYEDREIIFDYTESSRKYDEISQLLLSQIADGGISVTKGKEILKKLYSMEEEGMKQFTKYAPCSKGCSHCCHIYMDCTAVEAELVREYVVKNFSEEKIMELEKKIEATINEVPSYKDVLNEENKDKVIADYSKKNIPCIFLKEDNSCSIYEVRPFNCRKFFTVSDSAKCKKGEEVIRPAVSINNITQYAVNYLSMSINRYKSLKTYSREDGEDKAIYKSLQYWFKNGFKEIDRDRSL
ncbi:SEC-C metal-binding domain-containing protein [Clostridium ganghwense]|uniref:SEC-C metal-binding domain-containing protein n=1 Tax=Clostridium ganghwense TaxID=312089 RepID=A0ABT4CPN9_9CLOT|nr:SEC-C metal-binding domain-containing protein [Clostridium ganghwense]MCY6371016.1 SEC-C metal-binding domain-containing protein [Clostridium ganghwense]